jgi:hypothetical protein
MDAVIALNGTVSGAVDVGPGRLFGFVLPKAFTGTAITFQVSADGTNYGLLYDDAGSAVSCSVSAGTTVFKAYAFKADDYHCLHQWRYLKLVSNATEAAERTIQLWVR